MRSSPSATDALFAGATGFAHRGLHGPGVPENSMAAFRAAIAAGAGIECDVRLSRDGCVMVFHDHSLERLCGLPSSLSSLDAEALTSQRLNGTDEHIPMLGSLLSLVRGQVPLLVEVKAGPDLSGLCQAVAGGLEGYPGAIGVMSFSPHVGHWFARHAAHVPRGLVVDAGGGLRPDIDLTQSAADFLAVATGEARSSWVQVERSRGKPVACWTVRTVEQRETLADQVDALIWEGDGRP